MTSTLGRATNSAATAGLVEVSGAKPNFGAGSRPGAKRGGAVGECLVCKFCRATNFGIRALSRSDACVLFADKRGPISLSV